MLTRMIGVRTLTAAVRTEAGKTLSSAPYTYTSPDDPAREDEGLFGPGSVTWRVMNNRIMWVAIVRALYLQAMHQRVIRGTLQNAATVTQPVDAWARLRRTRTFIETRTFGTTAEAGRAGRHVRKIHEALTGTDPGGDARQLGRRRDDRAAHVTGKTQPRRCRAVRAGPDPVPVTVQLQPEPGPGAQIHQGHRVGGSAGGRRDAQDDLGAPGHLVHLVPAARQTSMMSSRRAAQNARNAGKNPLSAAAARRVRGSSRPAGPAGHAAPKRQPPRWPAARVAGQAGARPAAPQAHPQPRSPRTARRSGAMTRARQAVTSRRPPPAPGHVPHPPRTS